MTIIIYLKKLNKIQKTHVEPEVKNIQTEGEIKSQSQRDKDKNGKPTNQQSETPKIQQKWQFKRPKTKNTKPQTNNLTIDNQKTQIYKFSVEKTGKWI